MLIDLDLKCSDRYLEDGDSRLFLHDLVRLLLRYKAIGGSGFQAAIGGAAHAILRSQFGCTMECFASPLNARGAPFCSAFADTDAPFGSIGSFLDFKPESGCYEVHPIPSAPPTPAYPTPTRSLPDPYPTPTRPLPLPYHSFQANPPFVPSLVLTMASHVRGLLDAAEMGDRELLFVVIVGSSSAMRKSDAWGALQELAHGRFGRSQWIVPLHHHGYTAGHAHIEKEGEQRRMSSCESAVFVFASSAANQRWPSTPEKESLFRAAMRLALPQKMKRLRKADQKVSRQRKMSKKRRRVGQP